MSRINFKNTIEKEARLKEQAKKRKFVALRKMVAYLRESIKPGVESEYEFRKKLQEIQQVLDNN